MFRRLLFAAIPLLIAPILIAGAAWAQTASVEVKDAWARATPGKAETGAVYVTVQSPAGDRLLSIATPAAKQAELHTMTMEGGVMKMRPLDGVDLPAGQPVTLKPGGAHIMLMGLAGPLRAGQSFPLTLQFEKAGKREVTVAVQAIGAMGPQGQTGGGMTMPMAPTTPGR